MKNCIAYSALKHEDFRNLNKTMTKQIKDNINTKAM